MKIGKVFLSFVACLLLASSLLAISSSAQETFFATADDAGNVFIYPSNGDGTFSDKVLIGSVTLPSGYSYPFPAVADFNRDGYLDVAIHDNQNIYLLVNDGTNNFPQAATATGFALDPVWYYGTALIPGDFNNDGWDDIAIKTTTHGPLVVLLNNHDLIFEVSPYVSIPSPLMYTTELAAGDFNEDGNLDLILGYYEYQLYIFFGDGSGNFPSTQLIQFGFPGCSSLLSTNVMAAVAGDFNNDGHLDVLAGQDDDVDPGQAYLFLGDGTGNLYLAGVPCGSGASSLGYDTNPSYEYPNYNYPGTGFSGAFDFNDDGNLDVVATWGEGMAYFSGNGDGTFGTAVAFDPLEGYVGTPPIGWHFVKDKFIECFTPIAQAQDCLGETLVKSCLMENLERYHKYLFEMASDSQKSLRERIFAISYLIINIDLLTSEEKEYLVSEEVVSLIHDAIYQDQDEYLLEKGNACLVGITSLGDEYSAFIQSYSVQKESSLVLNLNLLNVENLIREILAESEKPELYSYLRRQSTRSTSVFLGELLFHIAYLEYNAPEMNRAMEILPVLDSSAVPWDHYIQALTSDVPYESIPSVLQTLNVILSNRSQDTIPEEIKMPLADSLLVFIPNGDDVARKAVIGLGLVGGYESFLLNEFKYGIDYPELSFALGQGGWVNEAYELLDMAGDESLEMWRRVKAAQAVYDISLRLMNDPSVEFEIIDDIFNSLYFNAISAVVTTLLNEEESIPTRHQALLFTSRILEPPEVTYIFDMLLGQTSNNLLIEEAIRLAADNASCEMINVLQTKKTQYENELDQLNQKISTLDTYRIGKNDMIQDKILEIGIKIDDILIKINLILNPPPHGHGECWDHNPGPGPHGEGKFDDHNSGLYGKREDKGHNNHHHGESECKNPIPLPEDLKEKIEYLMLLFVDFQSGINTLQDNLEISSYPMISSGLSEKVIFLQEYLENLISDHMWRYYRETLETLEEIQSKNDEIQEKVNAIRNEFNQINNKINKLLKGTGFSKWSDLFGRSHHIGIIINNASLSINSLNIACNDSESSFSNLEVTNLTKTTLASTGQVQIQGCLKDEYSRQPASKMDIGLALGTVTTCTRVRFCFFFCFFGSSISIANANEFINSEANNNNLIIQDTKNVKAFFPIFRFGFFSLFRWGLFGGGRQICTSSPNIVATTGTDPTGCFTFNDPDIVNNQIYDLIITKVWDQTHIIDGDSGIDISTSGYSPGQVVPVGTLYLPLSRTSDSDNDGIGKYAEDYIAFKHRPKYKFNPYDDWPSSDPKNMYLDRSDGWSNGSISHTDPSIDADFYHLAQHYDGRIQLPNNYQGWDLATYFYHVNNWKDSSGTIQGYRTQYYLFMEKSRNQYWPVDLWHDADWEWTCIFTTKTGQLSRQHQHNHGSTLRKTTFDNVTGSYPFEKPIYWIEEEGHSHFDHPGEFCVDASSYCNYTCESLGLTCITTDEYNTYGNLPGLPYNNIFQFHRVTNIDEYANDSYSGTIYYYNGLWGDDGQTRDDPPGGPNSTHDGRDYSSESYE